MIDLKVGMKCYASNLSLHAKGMEFKYKPPRGKRFAVILMGDEKPDNFSGMSCDDFLRNSGWELSQESDSKPITDWISCQDHLPEDTTDEDGGATGYLVLYEKGKEPNGGFNVGVWNVTYLRRWWSGNVTHWMSLPKLTEE